MPVSRDLIFTLDLEDHRPSDAYEKRYPTVTRAILDFLDERTISATVFVLGRLAVDEPDLIREISNRGHEIAFHTFAHVPLTQESPDRFRHETAEHKKRLEDLVGQSVIGFRAPTFSLTYDTQWAVDVISDLGFSYSSSVLPAKSPLYGFPGAPDLPFRWPNGLLEFPVPLARLGPLAIPFLGGIYLRYLPSWLVQYFLKAGAGQQCYWTYCHPYDFDHEEAYFRIEGTSAIVSILLWFNRRNAFKKLDSIFPRGGGPHDAKGFAARLEDGAFSNVPVFQTDRVPS